MMTSRIALSVLLIVASASLSSALWSCDLDRQFDQVGANLNMKCRACIVKTGFLGASCGFDIEAGTCKTASAGSTLVTDELDCPVGNNKNRRVYNSLFDLANRTINKEEVCSRETVYFVNLAKRVMEVMDTKKSDSTFKTVMSSFKAFASVAQPFGTAAQVFQLAAATVEQYAKGKLTEAGIEIALSPSSAESVMVQSLVLLLVETCRNGLKTGTHDSRGTLQESFVCQPCKNFPLYNSVKGLTDTQFEELVAAIKGASTMDQIAKVIDGLNNPASAPAATPGAAAPPRKRSSTTDGIELQPMGGADKIRNT